MEPAPLFQLGEVRITPGAEALLTLDEIAAALHRHQHGDYGGLDEADIHLNNTSASRCCMVMSAYRTANWSRVLGENPRHPLPYAHPPARRVRFLPQDTSCEPIR